MSSKSSTQAVMKARQNSGGARTFKSFERLEIRGMAHPFGRFAPSLKAQCLQD